MNLVPLIIQLISGAVGGNIAGALLKKFDLGPIGNSIAGIVGGGIGGHLLGMLTGGGAAAATAAAGSGLDMSSILSSVGGRRDWRRGADGYCGVDQGPDVEIVVGPGAGGSARASPT